MRVPQLSERIKEAPAQALRGVFAGIGQLLLITDKLRNKTPASQQVPQARAPEASETVNGEAVALLRRSERFPRPAESVLFEGNRILEGSAIRPEVGRPYFLNNRPKWL